MRALALCLALAVSGCLHLDETTRVERGPSLQKFEREVRLAGGYSGSVKVAWPKVTLAAQEFQICRSEKVEEFAEDRVTERTSSAIGPALSLGLLGTLGGGGLIAARGAFSGEPNRSVIDRGGNYGPSDRQIAAGWGVGLLVVGVPALVVGGLQLAQAGETTRTEKVEQVLSSTDVHCDVKQAAGGAALIGEGGPVLPLRSLVGGEVSFEASELAGKDVEQLAVEGRVVELPEADLERLHGFVECAELPPAPPEAQLVGLSTESLLERDETAKACHALGAPNAAPWLLALGHEAERRRAPVRPLAPSEERAIGSWAEAEALAAQGSAAAALAAPEQHQGEVVKLVVVLSEKSSADTFTASIGPVGLLLRVGAGRPFAGEARLGAKVEVVARVRGSQALGRRHLPLLEAVWLRAAHSKATFE